jgi:drug/metabolite transporter (DMT)-like permease
MGGDGSQPQSVRQAAMWMAGWLTATAGMTVAGRELARDISVFQLMLLRSLVATAILTPLVLLNGGFTGRLGQWRLHIARNIIHYGGQYLWFSALLLIPLAEVIAIEFTMPLWIAVLAVPFLGERLSPPKLAALALGFAGVALIAKPFGASLGPGHPVALAAALLFAGSVTLTKYITRRDSALTVIFLMFAIQSVIGLGPALATWRWPAAHSWLYVAVVASAGTVSHYCLSKAISLADATVVMPMDFLRLPITALLGFMIYQEGLDSWSLLGGLLILAANILNLRKARTA